MTLYDPPRHVSLPARAWDPAGARAWTARWAEAALAEWSTHGAWSLHPRDLEGPPPASPMHGIYLGSTGVWLALARVAKAGLCELPAPLDALFAEVHAAYRRTPDSDAVTPSWFLGESAILTARHLAAPEPALADRLAEVIHGNRDNPTREALWGAPGTMHAALFLHERTGDERWAALFRGSVEALWADWQWDDARGAWLWEQDLYGRRDRFLGAGHGWVGNLHPLWRGHALLDAGQQAALRERTLEGLTALAQVDGELANWPPLAAPPAAPTKWLVQWCHGAPGFITSLRHADLPELTPLLCKGARLIVRAGPLVKGVGLCHGTDGNGVALLEMARRTGDPDWLAHARELAMISIDQSESERQHHGVWRHSLWTGDAGLACFLLDCLDGVGRGMPGLDSMW